MRRCRSAVRRIRAAWLIVCVMTGLAAWAQDLDNEEMMKQIGQDPGAAVKALTDLEKKAISNCVSAAYVTPLALRLPFAYYPSSSEIELAFDMASPLVGEYVSVLPRPAEKRDPPRVPGLAYAYYTGLEPDQANKIRLPDFGKLTPTNTGVTAGLSIAPTADGTRFEGAHKRPVAVLFKGYLAVPETGVYTFLTRQYQVAKLMIGDRLIVDQPAGAYQPEWRSGGGAIALEAGLHPIALGVQVYGRNIPELPEDLVCYATPGKAPAPIPVSWFSHDPTNTWTLPKPGKAPAAPQDEWIAPPSVRARVVALPGMKTVAKLTLPLDAAGRGQKRFEIPELRDGAYTIEWDVAGKAIRSTLDFRRERFPWEGNELGLEHKVYPPFEPVKVDGRKVSVVDRTYTLNAQGTFDSVISKGRELLAGPIKLVVELENGQRVAWNDGKVNGKALHPDLAVFETESRSSEFGVRSSVQVEEDGCAKVGMTLNPEPRTLNPIRRAWLEIALPDAEAPLFHYAGSRCARHEYAGKTPRGGKIRWELDQGWVPCDWKAEPGPEDGMIWDASQVLNWGQGRNTFIPYVWLGGVERGFGWLSGTDRGHVSDGVEPMQELWRENGRVVLRCYFIRQPTTVDKPLQVTFGLFASPTKPIRPDWRTYPIPYPGPVNCFGGYACAEKYPDGRDFTIVDKLLGPARGEALDREWLERKEKSRAWPDMGIQYEPNDSWLKNVLYFSVHSRMTYYEEHHTPARYPEWQVFQDEWSEVEFNRFQGSDRGSSQAARSYMDFAVYYANEYLKRGVSVYFDNTMFKESSNPYNQGFVGRTMSVWTHREYYKRIWKRLTALNRSGTVFREVDFVGHTTGQPAIPVSTWFTGTLDCEQPYRRDKSRQKRGEQDKGYWPWMKWEGFLLPWPPERLQAHTMGFAAGFVPNQPMTDLSGGAGGLKSAGMGWVHELHRWNPDWATGPKWRNTSPAGQGQYPIRMTDFILWFGYGRPDVVVHNYWAESPFVGVSDPDVKWLALEKKGSGFGVQPPMPNLQSPISNPSSSGLLLLQSYKDDPVAVTVAFPRGGAMMDLFTRDVFLADGAGLTTIPLEGDYGVRLLAVAGDRAGLPPARAANALVQDDFELGLSTDLVQYRGDNNIAVVADERRPGNHLLRMRPGSHSEVMQVVPMLQSRGRDMTDARIVLRFRLPAVPTNAAELVQFHYRRDDAKERNARYSVTVGVREGAWVVQARAAREGKSVAFTDPGVNLLGKPVPGMAPDTEWHRLTIEARGARHRISLDDTLVFEGSNDASGAGSFSFGPAHWAVPFVDFDDLCVESL